MDQPGLRPGCRVVGVDERGHVGQVHLAVGVGVGPPRSILDELLVQHQIDRAAQGSVKSNVLDIGNSLESEYIRRNT